MKLLKCHIENYGKLFNVNYEFKDGINTIKEPNGYGKTTFASFIKAMFYGLEVKKRSKTLIERKKYTPWQGGAFGGNIEFELNSKKYKIERFFGKKEADDTFKLIDLSTNLESNDYSQNIGEEIFNLNKEAFERSTFISGQDIETSMNDSINAKLSNVLESENDVNTSEKAIKLLDEAIKIYKKTGGRGELNEKISEKTRLEQSLEQSKIDEKILQERKEQNEKIKKLIESKQLEQKEGQRILSNRIQEEARRAKMEQYRILKESLEESKKNLEKFNNNAQKDDDLKRKIEFNQTKQTKIVEELSRLHEKNKKTKIISGVIFILFIALVVAGIITFFKNKNIAIVFLVVSAITFIIMISKFISLSQIKRKIINSEQEKQSTEDLIETLETLYNNQLTEIQSEQKRLEAECEAKLNTIKKFENENNIRELENLGNQELSNVTTKELEQKINQISEEISKLNDELNYNKNQINVLESNIDSVIDIESEIEDINESIAQINENVEILTKTKDYLSKAKEQFSSHYSDKMNESFINNIKLLNGQDMDINLDINLEAKINANGENKEVEYFSTGYQDLIYICIRLSLIETLFEEEKPFIILDDPFVNLDEEKIKNAKNILKQISEKYQVIYLICHESRTA